MVNASNCNFKKTFLLVVVIVVLSILVVPVHAEVPQGPFFFDWDIRNSVNSNHPYFIPLPHPGHDYSANHQYYTNLFSSQVQVGNPVAIMLRDDTGPVDGTKDPNAMSTILGETTKLDFAFSDFEYPINAPSNMNWDFPKILDNNDEMKDLVRNNTSPSKNQAYLGAYSFWAGATNNAAFYPSQVDRTTNSNYYINSGLNVSNPNCYPYAFYSLHTTSHWPADNRAPNLRSSMFWGPLEMFSTAKRNLPSGHLLLPWVNVMCPRKDYINSVPERDDVKALIKHMRMRGTDGYMRLNISDSSFDLQNSDGTYCVPQDSWIRNYTTAQHRDDLNNSWHELDGYFTPSVRSYLNLETAKTSGVQWSGVRDVNNIKVLVSNLGNSAATVTYPDMFQLPTQSSTVNSGTHTYFDYTITNLFKNGNLNSDTTNWNLVSGATRDVTNGVGNTGCLKLQGANYSVLGTQKMKTEPGALMNITYTAKGESSAALQIRYYYYDKNGNTLGYMNTPIVEQDLTSSYQTYSSNFTIPSNSDIYSIAPIIYNKYGASDSTDIIYLDDMVMKFSILLENGSFNSNSTGWYLLSGLATRSTVNGVGDTGCLKLQGGYYSVLGTQKIKTKPSTSMNITYTAKGEHSSAIKISYYYYDASGATLGSASIVEQNLSQGYQTYSTNFTVPSNTNIDSIAPIIYNKYGASDSNDIIYLDDIVFKIN